MTLKFVGGFSGAIKDSVQEGESMVKYIEKVVEKISN